MKFGISGEITIQEFLEIAKFIRKMFEGRKEHVNIFVAEGTEHMSADEVLEILGSVWRD